MNLNVSSQNKARPVDTRLRALRRLSIPQSPEQQIEELHAAYNIALAETHNWVAECESLMVTLEAERERTAGLTEQLGCARRDAEHLVEALAAAYTSNARKAADAAQRSEELASALDELIELRTVNEDLHAHDHQMRKRCGDLSGLLDDVTLQVERVNARALNAETARKELHETLKHCLEEQAKLKEQFEAQGQKLVAGQARCEELGKALAETRAAHAQISAELAETTERFLAFVNEAHAERRVEVQTLSQLIDEAQQGRAWGIKRFLRKLWRK